MPPFIVRCPPAGPSDVSFDLLTSAGWVSTTVNLASWQRSCTYRSPFSFFRCEPPRGGREPPGSHLQISTLTSSCPVVAGGSREDLTNHQDSRSFFSLCLRAAQGPAGGVALRMVVRVIAFAIFMKQQLTFPLIPCYITVRRRTWQPDHETHKQNNPKV